MQSSKLQLKIQNFKNAIRSQKGFTLIELLVVIVIIGVLAALLMANFIGIRQRARDGQRKANLRQMQAALEFYRSDQATYATTANFPSCSNSAGFTGGSPAVTYMVKVPCDPLGGNYTYASDGTTYTLVACLENSNDAEASGSCSGSGGRTGVSYTLQNP